MRTLLLTAVLAICFSASLSAQDHLGTWTWQGQTPEGDPMPMAMEFKADNTYHIDFGADGTVEIHGTVSYAAGVMTIADSVGDCAGAKGVYTFTVDGDKATAEMISDECEPRSQGGNTMNLTRKD